MLFDGPYHVLPDVSWDIQINSAFEKTILKQVEAAQLADKTIFFQWHKPADTEIVVSALRKRSFQHLQHIFWHKTEHITQTPVSSYTSSVEMGTIGFLPNSNGCFNIDKNPRARHNFIECKSVTTYLKDNDKQILNPCQKPPELAQWICSNHCSPGSWVLVLGAGAGGEVEGALLAGCNVVAVESDKKQFDVLANAYRTLIAEQQQHLQEKTTKRKNVSSSSSSSSQSGPSSPDPSPAGTVLASNMEVQHDKCIDCGEIWTTDDPLNLKQWCRTCNTKKPLHKACCTQGADGTFLCPTHAPASPLIPITTAAAASK